jgi:multiple antibiotic resistance protein
VCAVQWRVFGETIVTLLVIMDPPGTAPIFVSLTREYSPRQRTKAAVGAIGAASALIVGFALFGRIILDYLHVSLESLSVAGGLLLLLVALEMLRGEDMTPQPGNSVPWFPSPRPCSRDRELSPRSWCLRGSTRAAVVAWPS